ncbi:hypothetical protein Tcan_13567 [Toxocara canis]|uniref:Lipid-binding serum glycoprotein C-terminal domain-containing protein n=1 Tax=Toxocara canis TaxID=6265 RepID=A0A0B2UZP0_TOXCA|nr:hypothetical protein Tcan_13567 [Toxocara canis]
MQLVPPIPISVPAAGTLLVTAIQMELGAVLDIQKHHDDKAYVRLVSCYIRKGMVNSKVENMGLLTTIVNLKYQNQMNEKAEDVIQRTICGDIQDIIDSEFNTRVAKIPAVISIKDVAQTLLKSVAKRRHSRAVRGTTLGNVSRAMIEHDRIPHAIAHIPSAARAHSIPNVASAVVSLPTNLQPVSSQLETLVLGATFNLEKLSPLILSLSILDTSATYDKFFVGINGDVYVHNHSSIRNPYTRPESLKFVTPTNGKALELLISEYTVNTLLLKAHSVGAVVFRIGSNTPVFGKLLQTTCSFDEVCLSDSVSEPGEKYPDKQLEMIVRSTKPPYIHFARDMATLHFEGRSLFYIEGTTEKVGVIPFETTMVVKARTENGRVHGTFSIPSLEYKNDVDFFDLPVDSLRGFRDANKGALLNVINAKLKEGIALELDEKSHIYNISVAFMNEAVLIQGGKLKATSDCEQSGEAYLNEEYR